jgi:hypothetical protein
VRFVVAVVAIEKKGNGCEWKHKAKKIEQFIILKI